MGLDSLTLDVPTDSFTSFFIILQVNSERAWNDEFSLVRKK